MTRVDYKRKGIRLESELVEEISYTSSLLVTLGRLTLVLLLEHLLHGLSGIHNVGTFHGSLVDDLLQVEVKGVSGRHNVVKVEHLHERLNFNLLVQLGLAHGSNNLARVSINAGN
jgi:hypothetical protein